MQLFLEILTIVLPVFLVIALGYGLKRLRLIDQPFLFQTNRLVFYVCLPLLLFYKIGTADFLANFNGPLVLGSVAVISTGFLTAWLYSGWRDYSPPSRGSFTQAAFRSNLAYMGLAIVFNAYGETGLTRAGILMGFLVPVLNFFSIFALILPQRSSGNRPKSSFWIRQIALNPLIIASFLGIAWSFLRLPIPRILEGGLHIATGMTLPLALLAIGGSFSLERLKGDLVKAALATGIKIVWLPLFAALLLRQIGVGGIDLAIGVIFAGAPCATANYIMAHQLGGDAELAGSTVMLSTLLSAVTYTVALLILRHMGL